MPALAVVDGVDTKTSSEALGLFDDLRARARKAKIAPSTMSTSKTNASEPPAMAPICQPSNAPSPSTMGFSSNEIEEVNGKGNDDAIDEDDDDDDDEIRLVVDVLLSVVDAFSIVVVVVGVVVVVVVTMVIEVVGMVVGTVVAPVTAVVSVRAVSVSPPLMIVGAVGAIVNVK